MREVGVSRSRLSMQMRWFKQNSHYRLLKLVSPFIAVVLLQAFVAGLSLDILSAVRA